MPQIHVIIPVYNAKKFLRQAVDSVLNQPYKGIDIVLVNDGSTDGSAELCDEIATRENRVSVIHQTNAGVSAARNAGIEFVLSKNTDEDYIAFLDADDMWSNHFFDNWVTSLLDKKYTLIGFQSSRCNSDCTKRENATPMSEGEFPGGTSSVWRHAVQHFGAMFYSVSLIDQYHLRFPLVKYCEDRSFIMQCIYLADRVYLNNRLMYYYRQNPASAVHTRPFGIQHFVPIIDTWIQTDDAMRIYADNDRGQLREGYTLARIYIMDLLDEHYRIGGTVQAIREVFLTHPQYVELWNSSIGSVHLEKRYQFVKKHPRIHRIANRLYGIVWSCVLKIKKNKLIRALIERNRYTITLEKCF